MMKNLFEQSRSHWVRYDHYEMKTAEDGKQYITPGKSAKPDVYNPLKEVPNIVLDALNVGMLMMGRKPEAEVEKAVIRHKESATECSGLTHPYQTDILHWDQHISPTDLISSDRWEQIKIR